MGAWYGILGGFYHSITNYGGFSSWPVAFDARDALCNVVLVRPELRPNKSPLGKSPPDKSPPQVTMLHCEWDEEDKYCSWVSDY